MIGTAKNGWYSQATEKGSIADGYQEMLTLVDIIVVFLSFCYG
jgi:hypothetical protein